MRSRSLVKFSVFYVEACRSRSGDECAEYHCLYSALFDARLLGPVGR